MAYSNSFFGMRRGSTKSLTFSINKGQQITKDRVTHVANPRSTAQMIQRLTFAAAALFYKRSIQNLFKFAFENKKQTESDYNAFMRANVKLAPTFTKQMIDGAYPSIAPWMLTNGSLESANFEISPNTPNVGILNLVYNPALADLDFTQWGNVSKVILDSYPTLADGDIITFVTACCGGISAEDVEDAKLANSFIIYGPEEQSPRMAIHQARIDTTSTELTDTVLPTDEFLYTEEDGCSLALVESALYNADEQFFYSLFGMALIFSRPSASGVKVSTSTLALSAEAYKAYRIGCNTEWKAFASKSFEVTQVTSADNILQGSLLAEKVVAQGIARFSGRLPKASANFTDQRIELNEEATAEEVLAHLIIKGMQGDASVQTLVPSNFIEGKRAFIHYSDNLGNVQLVASVVGENTKTVYLTAASTATEGFSITAFEWGEAPTCQGIKSTDISFPTKYAGLSGKAVTLNNSVSSGDELVGHLYFSTSTEAEVVIAKEGSKYYLTENGTQYNEVTVNGNVVTFGEKLSPSDYDLTAVKWQH